LKYTVREKFFTVKGDNDISDEAGQPVFRVQGKLFSARSVMTIRDIAGQELARVQRKLFAVLPRYEVALTGGEVTTVRRRLSSPLKPKWTIDTPGQGSMILTGDLPGYNFTMEREGMRVASISKEWVTLRAVYGVDIAPGENDVLLMGIVLVLEAEKTRKHRR
jgi:uncharacterized protein YxjI